jgi:2-amino-4-hydroxy-6-hydroxymethyldihydropteridine diphosphokinase
MLQEIAPMALSDSDLLGDFHFYAYLCVVPSCFFTFVAVAILHTVYLSLGSNQGNSLQILTDAIVDITAACGAVIAQSPVYRTAAWGKVDQPDFLNMAISISTNLQPASLLIALQDIEHQNHRIRTTKWGQRTLDLDILYYDNLILHLPHLNIPHPHLHQRAFVLVPLATIAPVYLHPVLNLTTQQLLAECGDMLEVVKL